jgi:hypothetical protein
MEDPPLGFCARSLFYAENECYLTQNGRSHFLEQKGNAWHDGTFGN